MRHELKRFALIFQLIITFSVMASAQTGTNDIALVSGGTAQTAGRTSADETFDLNISERRITQNGFHASTSVEAGDESGRGLLLRVGVTLSADEIDVLLRNVRGHIRFRASLGRVLERLNVRRRVDNAP